MQCKVHIQSNQARSLESDFASISIIQKLYAFMNILVPIGYSPANTFCFICWVGMVFCVGALHNSRWNLHVSSQHESCSVLTEAFHQKHALSNVTLQGPASGTVHQPLASPHIVLLLCLCCTCPI